MENTEKDSVLLKEKGKMFYTISEVAAEFDIEEHTLRYWEKEFSHVLSPRRQGNKRAYTPEDIRNIRAIYTLLKVKGMTVKGAKEALKCGVSEEIDTIGLLTEKLDIIRSKVENMLFEIDNLDEK